MKRICLLLLFAGLLAAYQSVAPVTPQPATISPAPTAAPTAEPTAAPIRAPLPLVEVEWTLMPDAPEAEVLFVRDGVLYAVESLPSGAITWSLNGTKWTYREAANEEIQLMASRGWLDTGDYVDKLLGGTRWGDSITVTEQTVVFAQCPSHDNNGYAARFFLRNGEDWIEINPPQDVGMFYSFLKVGNELIVAGQNNQGDCKIWQAQFKNLP